MGSSKQDTQSSQTENSQTAPYQPTQGLLGDIIGGLNGQMSAATPTSAENGALSTIQANAQNTPNYGAQATNLTNNLFTGGTQPTPMVNAAYNTYQGQLTPYANGSNLDPTKSPGMQQVLATIRNDVGNSVNSQFAGAGRDMSGMNQQALARGISQGEAAPLLSQYNTNVQNRLGAAGSLYGAGNSTAGLLSNLGQTSLGNQITGLSAAQQIPGMQNLGANSVLAAGQTARGLPLNNLGLLENLTIPIAGLGSQSSGTANGTSNTTSTPSLLQDIVGVGSLFSGGANSAASGFFSDRRLKKDIQQIGKLYDGTPVYRFRYVNEPTMRVGLMADDVEKYEPNAVVEIKGYKAVDYGKATDRAASMGAN